MDSDCRFDGYRVCPVGMPSHTDYRVRGNKLHTAYGGPAAFQIRGSHVYKCGMAGYPVYAIRAASLCDCRTGQTVYELR